MDTFPVDDCIVSCVKLKRHINQDTSTGWQCFAARPIWKWCILDSTSSFLISRIWIVLYKRMRRTRAVWWLWRRNYSSGRNMFVKALRSEMWHSLQWEYWLFPSSWWSKEATHDIYQRMNLRSWGVRGVYQKNNEDDFRTGTPENAPVLRLHWDTAS